MRFVLILLTLLTVNCTLAMAQGEVSASMVANEKQIAVGDQAHVFIEVQHNPATSKVTWTKFPDSIAHLEIEQKDKIDTIKNGNLVIYKQRLLISGFDSGLFTIPAFQFQVTPQGGAPFILSTDSLQLLVQTLAVDTTKPIKPIKGIIEVKNTWLDYLWIILGVLLFVGLAVFVFFYFIKNKKTKAVPTAIVPVETLQEKAMKLLNELDAAQLWQNGQPKEYYVRLTDIIRGYIEVRFDTPALELTTDELLSKAKKFPGLHLVTGQLSTILYPADMAKFAKAQPTPEEHIAAMQSARELIEATKPTITATPSQS